MSESNAHAFGRVDADGNVYLITSDGERLVGQYPDSTPEEALAFFERKFLDLEGQVRLLEQRIARGAKARDVRHSLDSLTHQLERPAAIGDVEGLRARLQKLRGKTEGLVQQQSEQAQAAVEAAIVERTGIVEEIEALAARDDKDVRWKDTGATVQAIFERWQSAQRQGPRIPKDRADALWSRFKAARATIDARRRAFFAHLDEQHKEAKRAKQALVAQAQQLAEQAEPRVNEYRALLDRWKASGRAGGKVDDRLWAEFKAAGDEIFSKKSSHDAAEEKEFEANLAAKLELLAEAEAMLPVKDREQARNQLRRIQDRWDEIGKVPRNRMREIEGRLRDVESAVRDADQAYWRNHDTEKQERAAGLAAQLQGSIAELEQSVERAKATGNARAQKEAEQKLAAQRSWLQVISR